MVLEPHEHIYTLDRTHTNPPPSGLLSICVWTRADNAPAREIVEWRNYVVRAVYSF